MRRLIPPWVFTAVMFLGLLSAVVLAGWSLFLTDDSTAARTVAPNGPIAVVNGVPISAERLVAAAERDRHLSRDELLDKLIARFLVLDAAKASGGLDDPRVRGVAIQVHLRILSKDLRRRSVSDDELRAYYAAHPEEFRIPERVIAKQIFIKNEGRGKEAARARAVELRGAVMADPLGFGYIARKYSEGLYRLRGGDLGYMGPNGKPGVEPEVVAAAFRLEDGGLSEVIESREGYSILQVSAHFPGEMPLYEDVVGAVIRRARAVRQEAWQAEYITGLRNDAEIRVDPEAMARAGATPQPGWRPTRLRQGLVAKVNQRTIAATQLEAAVNRFGDPTRAVSDLIDDTLVYQAALDARREFHPRVERVLLTTHLRDVVYSKVRNADISDAEIQAWWDEHHEELDDPERRQISRITVAITDDRNEEQALAKIQAIRTLVERAPLRFEELARKYSDGPHRKRGGDLGYVVQHGSPGVPDAVVERAWDAEIGVLSEIFRTEAGFEIIRVTGARDADAFDLEEMKRTVQRRVKNAEYQRLYDAYVETLQAGARITVDRERLAAVRLPSRES